LVLALTFIYALWIGLANGGQHLIDRSGGKAPIEEIQEVAIFVAEKTAAEDRIFAMEALWVVVEAERRTLPNMT
ncbi:MAG: hypothetical protein GWO38_26480, partial [Phycisphaerae bacterium]|nr:hypothetical protein [Phycisphaerae bacterium]NIP55002.1 hypothetical protein [Phycisphaerae bacterium]NIW47276.1 hypothetical protein [Gammaproteobacteria bacterium]NIX31076.1 hypothetical protein [Phycisphaerae bacterium]